VTNVKTKEVRQYLDFMDPFNTVHEVNNHQLELIIMAVEALNEGD
jgi:hypothetical protein